MNPNDGRIPTDKPRPESQPHGTTADQISEMESEGPVVTPKEAPKPTCIPSPHGTTAVPIPAVVK